MSEPRYNGNEIAIIGAAGRFPGAPDLTTYWQNLRAGVESIHHFSPEEWRALNLPQPLLEDPNFVRAAAFLDHPEAFDASFFDMSHREAELTDPQHRVLLECAWAALEDAGYHGAAYPGAVGVFAGATINTYLLFNLARRPDIIGNLSHVQLNVGNAGDFLATRIAYKLNLKGPSYTVQSACSTSLVAVHIACESLLNETCDMALAGGVSVNVSLRHGYAYVAGGMTSPDGRCRPFDAAAQGTIFGSGAGLVVLKRLSDALNDGDTIYAVIKGTAINNDGSLKVGYTAPSVEGQAQVIAEALANAGVSAETIRYVEAHGTATPLGDPIEIEALTKAFRAYTAANGFCALGSVKGNIGHLDAAAGIAGLLKTVLALKHRELPPSLHFERPNPNIDFPNTPFYVNTALSHWPDAAAPCRAGVSAFGVGGTNAHIILEEAPPLAAAEPSRPWQLLPLSAQTQEALDQIRNNLTTRWQAHPSLDIADVAYTLQVGRQPFRYRQMVLAQTRDDALAALAESNPINFGTVDENHVPSLVFMFTGQGSQQINMGRGLYEQEPAFRQTVDYCAQVLRPRLGLDMRELLYPRPGAETAATAKLNQTAYSQPALFVLEYASGQLLLSWGLRPQALVGHSIGEYVAACLAGVFSLEEALLLVAERGRLMQALPGGTMLAVPLSELELQPFLNGELSLAVINGPGRTVVSGSQAAIAQFEAYLQTEGIMARPLQTSHAFHSVMMEPILETFTEVVSQITLRPPQIPYLSNVTGTWITSAEATSPTYWARHLRGTVRFADNLTTLLEGSGRVLLEVGPGETLCQLVRRHPHYRTEHTVFPLLPSPRQQQTDDLKAVLQAVGHLWLRGLIPDWQMFYGSERRRRIPLPTYPLAQQRHWIEAALPEHATTIEIKTTPSERNSSDQWFYLPAWKRVLPPVFEPEKLLDRPRCWLVFADEQGLATEIVQILNTLHQTVTIIHAGYVFHAQDKEVTLNPARPQDYESLVAHLRQHDTIPDTILHLWHISGPERTYTFTEHQARGYYSLLYLMQALGNTPALAIVAAANQLLAPVLDGSVHPEKTTILGVCQVLPQEYEGIQCQVVDVGMPVSRNAATPILALATQPTAMAPLIIRGTQCWQQSYQPIAVPAAATLPLTQHGVYLMSGGLLEMGLEMAHYLAKTVQARLVLLEEAPFPAPAAWDEWLVQHGPTDDISVKIMQARRLCDAGAELLVVEVDYADTVQIQAAVRQGAAQFGPIQGFIHNARVLGERSFRLASDTSVTESEWQFVPKVHSLRHLAQALEGQPLAFALLNSSLASVMGGVGMVAYAAANSFVDAFARQQNQAWGGVWTSVNWDAWQNTQVSAVSADWARVALTSEEAITSLERVLGMRGVEQVVISTLDLPQRLARGRAAAVQAHLSQRAAPTFHPRPEHLSTLYMPPEDEQEKAIVAVWQEALGVMPVGVLDNFFELGGDSLLAVHTVSQLKKVLQTDIPVVTLYEGLTVRSLTTALQQAATAAAQHDETAASRQEERATRLSQRRKVQEESRARRERRQI